MCSTENLKLIKDFGADFALDYKSKEFNLLNRPKEYDVVMDTVDILPICTIKKIVKPKGKIILVSGMSKMIHSAFSNMFSGIKIINEAAFLDKETTLKIK